MSAVSELLARPTAVGVWTVDAARSKIEFKSKSLWGLFPVSGQFKQFGGEGQITDSGTVFGRLDIAAESLDTKIRKRDEHLRSKDFFEVATFPDISVVVGGIDAGADTGGNDIVDLRTELTIRGVTKPQKLRAYAHLLDDGAVRLTTKAVIDRRDFGIDTNSAGMLANKATILGDVVFRHS